MKGPEHPVKFVVKVTGCQSKSQKIGYTSVPKWQEGVELRWKDKKEKHLIEIKLN